jgi:DNA-directed RNA polymerase subunit beta
MAQQLRPKIFAVKDSQIQEIDDPDEVDFEIPSTNNLFGSHINLIPIHNAVQGPRLFYGARFYNQAMPVEGAEAPLVQNLSDDGETSFDEIFGRNAGAVFADDDMEIVSVEPDEIVVKDSTGKKRSVGLYNMFPFNRKSSLSNTAMVKPGQKVPKGSLLAKSNYTDDKGSLALGLNARVALLPYKGYSMDDAVVFSESFAKRLKSEHTDTFVHSLDSDTKLGRNHFISLFPDTYTKKQLTNLDPDGVVKPGTILRKGDPLVLSTKPKAITSTQHSLGRLSKVMRHARQDSSETWDDEVEGAVTDVAKTRNGVKVIVRSLRPLAPGDKATLRSGQKGVTSLILSDEKMPRTIDGKPLDILLNSMGVPSRVNDSLIYELLLGKVAAKLGRPIKVPNFNKLGEKWYEQVQKILDENGVSREEELFDPRTNKKLENPVLVGNSYCLKLHHTSHSKVSARGVAGYTLDQQPAKGSGEGAGSKRMSMLEIAALISSGAYKTLKESSTLRGQKNDQYWRELRQGYQPRQPGVPFVWNKFLALLNGAGLRAQDLGAGKHRLGPFTDKELDSRRAVEIKHGGLVDLNSLEPVKGGLFDPAIVGNNAWGKINLPFRTVNPAFEEAVRELLGLTKQEFRDLLAGKKQIEVDE